MVKNDNVSRETYNGWENYATWCVNLWLNNERSLYDYVIELRDNITEEEKEYPEYMLADAIKEFITEDLAETIPTCGMFADLLGYAIDKVNFYEIAEAFMCE